MGSCPARDQRGAGQHLRLCCQAPTLKRVGTGGVCGSEGVNSPPAVCSVNDELIRGRCGAAVPADLFWHGRAPGLPFLLLSGATELQRGWIFPDPPAQPQPRALTSLARPSTPWRRGSGEARGELGLFMPSNFPAAAPAPLSRFGSIRGCTQPCPESPQDWGCYCVMCNVSANV